MISTNKLVIPPVRRLVLALALGAALLGATGSAARVQADGEDAPPSGEAVAAAPAGSDYYASGNDNVVSSPFFTAQTTLERSLTTVPSGCRPGVVAARATLIRSEGDPTSGYILVAAISDSGRAALEKLTPTFLDACFEATDASIADKAAFDEQAKIILDEAEVLLAMP